MSYHQAQIDHAYLKAYRADARSEQNGCCKYCRSKIRSTDTTADHVVARRHGGQTARGNIVAACRRCNKAKGALSVNAFMAKVKHPSTDDPIGIRLAHVRRRLSLCIERAERRILAIAGITA